MASICGDGNDQYKKKDDNYTQKSHSSVWKKFEGLLTKTENSLEMEEGTGSATVYKQVTLPDARILQKIY